MWQLGEPVEDTAQQMAVSVDLVDILGPEHGLAILVKQREVVPAS